MARVTKAQQAERDESKTRLLQILEGLDRVYCICTHVARSGMQRRIRFLVPSVDSQARDIILDISWHVARALGWRLKDGAVVVDGCGMDMGFHTVHSLCYALWGLQPDDGRRGGYQLRSEWL